MLAGDVLHVRVNLIAITILRGVKAKAWATCVAALQSAAATVDEVNEAGSHTLTKPARSQWTRGQSIDACRNGCQHSTASQHRKVVGDERICR